MKFDLHMHTIYSDGRSAPADVLEVAKQKQIGVAITDHNHIKGAIIGKNLAVNENIPFICGIELGTSEGKEMLLYFTDPCDAERFYTREVESFRTNRMTRIARSMSEFVERDINAFKQEYNIYFSVIPHPYGPLYKSVEQNANLSKMILNFVDGIEAINASMSNVANKKAYELALRTGEFATASTDAHIKNLIGNLTTEVTFDENSKIVATDISHNKYKDSFFSIAATLLQITKCNITHSILKKGDSRV